MKRKHESTFEGSLTQNLTIPEYETRINAMSKLYFDNCAAAVLSSIKILSDNKPNFDKFVKYNNYSIFNLLIKYKDIKTIKYLFDNASERTKFLVACHDNYALLDKLVERLGQDIIDNKFDEQTSKLLLETFVAIKPAILKDVINNIIEQKEAESPELKGIISDAFKEVVAGLDIGNDMKQDDSFINKVKKQRLEQPSVRIV